MPSLCFLYVIHILRRRHFRSTSGETSEKNLTQKSFYRTKRFAVKFQVESLELFLTYQVYFHRYRHLRPSWLKIAKNPRNCYDLAFIKRHLSSDITTVIEIKRLKNISGHTFAENSFSKCILKKNSKFIEVHSLGFI